MITLYFETLSAAWLTARHSRVTVKWLRAEAGRISHLRADDRLLFDVHMVECVLLERARKWHGGRNDERQPKDDQFSRQRNEPNRI